MNSIQIRLLLILLLFLCKERVTAQVLEMPKFDSLTIKGTSGYFRVGKTTQGQWWFLDPDNKLFYYRGICAVNRAGTAGGRTAKPKKYAVTIDDKYGYQQSPDRFVNAIIEKIQNLGFNALGAWATEEFFNKGIPFTEILEFFKEAPFLPSLNDKQGLPDIFHPEWLVAIDRKARALCSPLRTSKELVGYFTDNEIGFGKTDDYGLDLGFQAGQFDFALLRQVLAMNHDEPACKFAWNFLLDRHQKSYEKLSEAWRVKISSKEDLKKLNDNKSVISASAFTDDAQAFVKLYAERYFEMAAKAIRRYDPNHLILGCRFGTPPPNYVLDAIKPSTDVISANNYQPILYERYDTVYQYTGLPILIGEFSWNTDLYKKIPFPTELKGQLAQKERMFKRGTTTLSRTAMHNGIVGFTWYRWVQGTCTDEKYFDGIVNYGDSLEIHALELKRLNATLENVRLHAAGDDWKNKPIDAGEMTFFFDKLRPNWTQYLMMGYTASKPSGTVTGWKMSGKVLKFNSNSKNNTLTLRLEVDFEDATSLNKAYEGGVGIYNVTMTRLGEKFYGSFKGKYNGKPLQGNVKAFYFPQSGY